MTSAASTIMVVYGTRPEAIKVAPVIQRLKSCDDLHPTVVVTGQHREMLDQVNTVFRITPDFDLDIFRAGQGLEDITSRTLTQLGPVLQSQRPDAVLVQGDTTTAFAAALCAFYNRVPVIHLEAGLRTDVADNPFPEEMNRRLVTRVASLHLAPTPKARDNLLREAVSKEAVVVTGNTVIDAFHNVLRAPYTPSPDLVWLRDDRPVVVVTAHRRESWGGPMARAGRAVARLAQTTPQALFVLPLHRNPIVREVLEPLLSPLPNVVLTEPLAYADFAHLLERATIVLTDSGGVQEEAPSIGKPVLVMRDTTERPEAVTAGTVRLVGTDEERIVSEIERLMHDPKAYSAMANAVNPYGDGQAARRSTEAIRHFFGIGPAAEEFSPATT